jgi:monofunctional biosynthetic peptidoglycan transglycosylase
VARSGKKAGAAKKPPAKRAAKAPGRLRRLVRRGARAIGWTLLGVALIVLFFGVVNPPITYTMWAEGRRVGHVERDWVPAGEIAPVMLRAAVAAEDANFCWHWGFDMAAIRTAIEEGATRGASTISQQVVKNVFLWQGRSWVRKALEAVLTPVVEVFWTKRRILEVYLNVAEFGDGIFGVEAAAQHYYGIPAAKLSPRQAARLAVILPNPKERDPNRLSPRLQRLAARVADGAETIRADGRAACFES